MNISPLENIRQQRNLTNSQYKNNLVTQEGVVVNNLIKDKQCNLSDTKDAYVISDQVSMPEQLYNDNRVVDKKLVPLSGIVLGVMGAIAIMTGFVSRSARIAKDLEKEKCLGPLTRNVNLSTEDKQIMYQMVQNPSKKTFLAGIGTLTLGAMGFMGKTFFDGYKDVWVKRKEADIQKNLQENLIDVETQSFSGKMQIIRSMLSKYTNDFEKYINDDNETALTNFGKRTFTQIPFGIHKNPHLNPPPRRGNSSNFGNLILGVGTFVGIIGLGFLSLKNLSKSRIHLDEGLKSTKDAIKVLVQTSKESTKTIDKDNLEHMFRSIEGTKNAEEFITEQVNLLSWEKSEEKLEFLNKILTNMKTSTTKANPNYAGDGVPKPAFNSFVNEYLAFFYNWLLDTSNPQFRHLFFGIAGVSALSYGGKLAGDAIKEVQVKKINAETELELQKRLVSTELRNFKSKKDSVIQPLVNEFYRQVDSGKRSKQELKTMAENVLFEVKNGPPFVYS